MARNDDYRDDRRYEGNDTERQERADRYERERPWNFNEPFPERGRPRGYRSDRFGRGRFGERADYESNEPRYGGMSEGYRDTDFDRPSDREYYGERRDYNQQARSRLRCRDIMTRDLVVATRDTTLREVAMMMKDEDVGVIPVVEPNIAGGNGSGEGTIRRAGGSYGQLVGLITDRDIVLRAVADDKDCRTARAGEIMSTDIVSARPDDRVIDILQRMSEKQIRRTPVVSENGNLRGMISLGDIALETEADRPLADALEDISKKPSFWNRIFS